MMWSAKSM